MTRPQSPWPLHLSIVVANIRCSGLNLQIYSVPTLYQPSRVSGRGGFVHCHGGIRQDRRKLLSHDCRRGVGARLKSECCMESKRFAPLKDPPETNCRHRLAQRQSTRPPDGRTAHEAVGARDHIVQREDLGPKDHIANRQKRRRKPEQPSKAERQPKPEPDRRKRKPVQIRKSRSLL